MRSTDKGLQSMFNTLQTVGEQLQPSYNIALTQQVRIVIERTPREEPEAWK